MLAENITLGNGSGGLRNLSGTNILAGAIILAGDVSWVIETSETLAPGSWTPQVTHAPGDATATILFNLTPVSPARNFVRLKVMQN